MVVQVQIGLQIPHDAHVVLFDKQPNQTRRITHTIVFGINSRAAAADCFIGPSEDGILHALDVYLVLYPYGAQTRKSEKKPEFR